MFSKKDQLQHKKRPKLKARKEERQEERQQKFIEHDSPVYDQVKERAFDWTIGDYRCENCKAIIGNNGQMHHLKHRSQIGETTLENVR